MGNAKSSQGTLSIVLDPPAYGSATGGAYVAGQILTGSVYAQSKSNIASSSHTPLNIAAYISGKERSRVRYKETQHYTENGKTKTRSVTRYRNAERSLIHMELNLGELSSVAAGSRFRFPFQITLPPDLPGTMHASENGGGGHCEINYKIKAELKGSGIFGNKTWEQRFVVISPPLPPQPMPNLVNPLEKDVNFCCCFKLGSIAMGARVENTRIGRGESVAVDFACKNQSLRRIERAEVKVIEEVHWTASSKSNHSKNVIASRTFNSNHQWKKLSKGEVKELRTMSRSMPSSFQDQRQKMLQSIYAAIYDAENRATLNVPPSALQTYQGLLIHVTHLLKIKVYTSGFCTDNPKVVLPIYIGTPSTLLGGGTQQSQQLESSVAVASPLIPSAPPLYMSTEISSTAPISAPMIVPSAPPAEWDGAVTATPVISSGTGAILGGTKIWESEENGDDEEAENIPLVVAELAPTLPNLLNEIKNAVSPMETVRKRLGQVSWNRAVFEVMTPSNYASMIHAVSIEFDQPDIAVLVAPAVRGGHFTHDYIISALRVVANWLRTPLVSKLLPLCKDLNENASKIKAELSDWERVCTERDFEQAMKYCKN